MGQCKVITLAFPQDHVCCFFIETILTSRILLSAFFVASPIVTCILLICFDRFEIRVDSARDKSKFAGKRKKRVSVKANLSTTLVAVEQHYICCKIVELNYIHCIVSLLILLQFIYFIVSLLILLLVLLFVNILSKLKIYILC